MYVLVHTRPRLSSSIIARSGWHSRSIHRPRQVPKRHFGSVLARLFHVGAIVPEAGRVLVAADDDDAGPGRAASCLA
jgi:hypothetical protein